MIINQVLKPNYMDEAGDDGAAGGGAGGEGDQTSGQGGGSAISQGGGETIAINEAIPEKYRVFGGESGEDFDLEASTRKLADGYDHLAKRMGTGDAPPEDADGYEIDGKEINEEFNFEEWKKDETNSSFLKAAHAKGFNNAQVQWLLGEAYNNIFPAMNEGNAILSQEDCVTSLKTDIWKTDGEFKENMAAANRVFTSLPKDLQTVVDKELGNSPAFNRVMAIIGKEMKEDRPATETSTSADQATIEEKMMSEAYKDPKHPQHEKVSAEVRAHFQKKHPGKVA